AEGHVEIASPPRRREVRLVEPEGGRKQRRQAEQARNRSATDREREFLRHSPRFRLNSEYDQCDQRREIVEAIPRHAKVDQQVEGQRRGDAEYQDQGKKTP